RRGRGRGRPRRWGVRVASRATSQGGRGAPNKWLVAGTVLTGTIMAVLDSSIVNVALPDMAGTLGATIGEITWVVSGYILATVIIMPIIALLSSRFGRKRFYQANVILFTVASMACGLSHSLPEMVFFRILQGVGGGVLITVAQAILRETFPPEEQGVAMGLYGLGTVLAPAIGPTLGGWLTDTYSWPWVFFINVPIGVVNTILVSRYIEDPPYLVREKGSIDWTGLGLMAVGLGALQLMLEQGQDNDWFNSTYITVLGAAALLGLVFFVWRELTTERPAVDLRILKNLSLASGTALGGVLGMGLMGSLFLLPIFLQNLLGFTATESGLALMPRSLAMAVIMPLGGRVYNRVGPRILVGIGLVVSAISFWQLSHLTTTTGVWNILMPQVWQGVGFGMIFVALSTAALSTIERPKITAATGLYNVVRQVCGSIGIALAATELTRGTARYHDALAEHVTGFDATSAAFMARAQAAMQAAGADAGTAYQRALALLNGSVLRQAAVLAYNHVFELVTLLFVLAVPLVFLLAKPGASTEPVEIVAE
ncbi:MAG TPA: DHA2 family efflux MFS transporter permease subunit, partial [Longimicrobiales bacterium]